MTDYILSAKQEINNIDDECDSDDDDVDDGDDDDGDDDGDDSREECIPSGHFRSVLFQHVFSRSTVLVSQACVLVLQAM